MTSLTFEKLLSTKQAAAQLGLHTKTVEKMARAGQVPVHRIGGLWRFYASELEAWVRSNPPVIGKPTQ